MSEANTSDISETLIFDSLPEISLTSESVDSTLYSETLKSESFEDTISEEETIHEREKVDENKNVCACRFDNYIQTESPTPSDLFYNSVLNLKLEEKDEPAERTQSSYSFFEGEYLAPFKFKWSFGINLNVPVLNLSTNSSSHVFYTIANRAILYDYNSHSMKCTHFHNNSIVATTTGETGKWVVTSDLGEESKIIFINSYDRKIIRTICNEPDDQGALALGLSPNGKYLITIHKQGPSYLVKFWLWTFGNEQPDDTLECPGEDIGMPKKIEFHPNQQEYIMIAFENQVIFFSWNEPEQKMEKLTKIRMRQEDIPITGCAMLPDSHNCFASTSSGKILMFGSHPLNKNPSDIDENCFIRSIRVSGKPILNLLTVDKMLVCINSIGYVRYFNSSLMLLYFHHDKKIPNIRNISFSILPRRYKIEKSFSLRNAYFRKQLSANHEELQCEDNENEIFFESKCPHDTTLQEYPFIIRTFIASTEDGNFYYIDMVNKISKPFHYSATSPVASIDCYLDGNYIAIIYENERISLFDYTEVKLLLTDTTICQKRIANKETDIKATFLKYSPGSLHLASGNTNGEIWFFNLLMKPIDEPYRYTANATIKIAFSPNAHFMAYYDSKDLLVAFKYDQPRWLFLGKVKPHCKRIRDIMFYGSTPTKLFTISEDRYLVEYDVENENEDLLIKSRISIEQSANPQCFLFYPYTPNSEDYFLFFNDQFKYKLVRESDKLCTSVSLGPSYGCFNDSPLKEMQILPESNGEYLIFSNKSHIGIQMLPPDGNPYKYVAIMANPNIKQFVISKSGDYVFTCGVNDFSVMIWEVKTNAVNVLRKMGGKELEPYYCLIEGGSSGWVFKEMQDVFCYMQVLGQGDFYQEQKFGETLRVTEVPDLLRSCGYYPSQYEIQEVLNDIKYRDFSTTGNLRETIKFSEFVILYINHRPAHGISMTEFREKFEKLFDINEEFPSIDRETFVEYLTTYGEPFTMENADQCLGVLAAKSKFSSSAEELVYRHLPKEINFEMFAKDLLGILQESVYEETQVKKLNQSIEEQGEPI